MAPVAFEVSRDVGAPPERVWAVLADYSRDHEWRSGVQMRQEPPGLAVAGALTYERLRLWGREMRVVARLEEVEAGRRLTFRTVESDVPVWGERRVEPWGSRGGSRVTVRIEMSPSGLWSLMRRPLGALFKRRFERDLERLALVVQATALPSGAPLSVVAG